MGLNHHRQLAAEVSGTLGCGRRTDAEGRREPGAAGGGFGDGKVWRRGKERKGLMRRLMQHAGVGHRANRTVMAGELGIFRVNVVRLRKPNEGDKQDASQGHSPEQRTPALLSGASQEKIIKHVSQNFIIQAGFEPHAKRPWTFTHEMRMELAGRHDGCD